MVQFDRGQHAETNRGELTPMEDPKAHICAFDPATSTIGELTLMYDFAGLTKVYFFSRLLSKNQRKGGGTKVLNELKALADTSGIPIINEVNAYGEHTQEQTMQWYKDRNFIPYKPEKFGKNSLIYWPNELAKPKED